MQECRTAPRRIVVKLSGEALGGAPGTALDAAVLARLATDVAAAAKNCQIALVIGGGNLLRGATLAGDGIARTTADHMGMLATIINALAFRDVLRGLGAPAEALSSHAVASVVDGYSVQRADALLRSGAVALLAGGTGNPLFTTDTAAILRAIELGASLVVKATKVDGVYAADPAIHPDAARFDALTYAEAMERRLGVLDLTAMALAQEHGLPMLVCDINAPGALTKAAAGAKVGTRIAADRAK